MQAWALDRLHLAVDTPQILGSDEGACRVAALLLPKGEALHEHQAAESTVLFLTRGLLLIGTGAGERTIASPSLIRFEPGEERQVRAVIECQVVLCCFR
jgi:quercetin dioxygenase-like cupin family protein